MVTKRKTYIPPEHRQDEYNDLVMNDYEMHGKVANLFSEREEVITAVINQKVSELNEKILALDTTPEQTQVLKLARVEILDILGMLSRYAVSFERRKEELEEKNKNNNNDDE